MAHFRHSVVQRDGKRIDREVLEEVMKKVGEKEFVWAVLDVLHRSNEPFLRSNFVHELIDVADEYLPGGYSPPGVF